MTKQLGSILFLISACTASVDDANNPGGDDDMMPGDGDMPGDGEPTGNGNGAVSFRATSVYDERTDQIDFTTGEPVHSHAGAKTSLGGVTCPDVYKYSYLMDAQPPAFGREVAPNPLAFKIELENPKALDVAAAAYRVRSEDGTVALDWSPLPTLTDSIATIALTRTAIPSLGVRDGKLYLDIRTPSKEGEELVATACWNYHPLAAPLEVKAPVRDLDAMTFALGAPLSQLLGTTTNVPAFSQRFVHHTAEPVTFAVELAKPTGTFTRRAVDDFVVARTVQAGVLCSRSSDGFESGDPLCTNTSALPEFADLTITGPLASGAWSLRVIDEATGTDATGCTITNATLRATCQIPARAPTGAAKSYRVVLAVRDLEQLAPSTEGPYTEHTIAGQVFTGRVLETAQRCANFVEVTKFGVTIVTCATATEYTRIHALDQGRIAFNPIAFALTSAASATLPALPLAAPAIPAFTWDTGDADLPGPQ